jgi:hypothetical protein
MVMMVMKWIVMKTVCIDERTHTILNRRVSLQLAPKIALRPSRWTKSLRDWSASRRNGLSTRRSILTSLIYQEL